MNIYIIQKCFFILNCAMVLTVFSSCLVQQSQKSIEFEQRFQALRDNEKNLVIEKSMEGFEYVADQVNIKFNDGVKLSDINEIKERLNAIVLDRLKLTKAELWKISKISVEKAIELYSSDPRIKYIEPNYITKINSAFIPNDPRFNDQWALHNTGQRPGSTLDADIDAPEAWYLQTGGDVIIGFIDTGIDYYHEDLAANMWINPNEKFGDANGDGYPGIVGIDDDGDGLIDEDWLGRQPGEVGYINMVNDDDENGYSDDVYGCNIAYYNSDDPWDDGGHGTHVAGISAANGDNGIGIAGVNYSAKIMAIKTQDEDGYGTSNKMAKGIEYATMMGAKIINISLGFYGSSSTVRNALIETRNAGILCIAGAGNDGTDNDIRPSYPASYDLDNIISVTSTVFTDEFSGDNFGLNSVDLGAPGYIILSTLPDNNYGYKGGTSQASPFVAGAASLIWARWPDLTYEEVKYRILNSVDPIASLQGKTVTGGRLNIYRALGNFYYVNTTDDLDDGTCNEFHCSLREAINASNNNSTMDQIHFNIANSGPHTIQLLSPLPTITDPVCIDATSQPGNVDAPMIKLFSPWTTVLNGFVIKAGNSIVRGFEIQAAGDGIQLHDNGNNVIERNVIHSWHNGIRIENSSNNIVGGFLGETGNILYNNVEGIYITGTEASGNKIVGNIVGANGTIVPTGNNHNGIYIFNSSGNIIGGNQKYEMNIISGNGENGICISGSTSIGNEIISNSIYSNSRLGIDLNYDGVTPNNPSDGDQGTDNPQDFPVLTSTSLNGIVLEIKGTIKTTPHTRLRIQLFSNSVCDLTNYGEGKKMIRDIELITSQIGYAGFEEKFLAFFSYGSSVTATATGPSGTSEFSNCLLAGLQIKSESTTVRPFEENIIFQSLPRLPDFSSYSFSSSWTGSDVEMTLTSPDGVNIGRNTIDPNVKHEIGPNYEVYNITNPEAGQWSIELNGVDVSSEGEVVNVSVVGLPVNATMVPRIDIKPDDESNEINCADKTDVFQVAILTDEQFNALIVDHTTVRFGRTGVEAIDSNKKRQEEDVDEDGDNDLIFYFRFKDTNIECCDEQAFLTGKTFKGTEIIGFDKIRTVYKN